MLRPLAILLVKLADTINLVRMRPSKKEIVLGLPVVGFVSLALFARWIPVPVQSVLFVMVLILGFVIIVAGWWGWASVRLDGNIASWRKKIGLLGLVANTLAITTPFVAFVYAFATFNLRLQGPRLDWLLVAPVALGLALGGVTAGIVAPRQVRLATVLGGLIVAALIMAVPIGVL